MLASARHENVRLYGIRETRTERARWIRGVECGKWIDIRSRMRPVGLRHPVKVPSTNREPIYRFRRGQEPAVGLNVGECPNDSTGSGVILCILEFQAGGKCTHGKFVGDIAGAYEEENPELIGEPIQKSGPRRQVPMKRPASVAERYVDDDYVRR